MALTRIDRSVSGFELHKGCSLLLWSEVLLGLGLDHNSAGTEVLASNEPRSKVRTLTESIPIMGLPIS